MRTFFTVLGLLLSICPLLSTAQIQSTHAYRDNSITPGVSASVRIDYVPFRSSNTEVRFKVAYADFDLDASKGYRYEGKVYGAEVPGLMELLGKCSGASPTVTFDVFYGPHKHTTVKYMVSARDGNMNVFSGDGFNVRASEAQTKDLSAWRLEAVYLESFLYRPDPTAWTGAENRIKDFLRGQETEKKYQAKITEADQAFKSASTEEELSRARGLYYQAQVIKSDDDHAKAQIAEIDRRVKALREKKAQDAKTEATAHSQDNGSPARQPSTASAPSSSSASTKTTGAKSNTSSSQTTLTAEDVSRSLQKQTDDYWAGVEATNRRIEAQTQRQLKTFYAVQAVSASRQNLSSLTRLSGDFSSLEELEAEFNEKHSAINDEVDNLTAARQDALQSGLDAALYDSDATGQAVGEAISLIGTAVNDARAQREREQAYEALEQSRKEEAEKLHQRKLALQRQLRANLLAQFPDGGLPLSSHYVANAQVYFFSYIYSPRALNSEDPAVLISNVFPVGKYSDDTWPYRSTLKTDLTNIARFGEATLVGYFLDYREASEARASFQRLAEKSYFKIGSLQYAGKNSKAVKTSTPVTTASQVSSGTSAGSTQKAADADFWEDGGTTSQAQAAATARTAVSYYNEGIDLNKEGKVDEALEAFKHAVRIDPTLSHGWYNIGVEYYNRGIRYYNQMTELPSDRKAEAETFHAAVQSNFDQALPCLEKVYALTPTERSAVVALRFIYTIMKRPADAERMKKALEGL